MSPKHRAPLSPCAGPFGPFYVFLPPASGQLASYSSPSTAHACTFYFPTSTAAVGKAPLISVAIGPFLSISTLPANYD